MFHSPDRRLKQVEASKMAGWGFRGGVHPSYSKQLSAGFPIETMPPPPRIEIPLTQHLGRAATPVVTKGDDVICGQLIAAAPVLISANIHSPVAGKVRGIVQKPMPGGSTAEYVQIQVDSEATSNHQWSRQAINLTEVNRKWLNQTMRSAGIVGMGGATFPADVKYSPPPTAKLDTLIVNGAECEPYLTCDHRVMLENADRILEGIGIINAAFKFERIVVAIERNKPDALHAFRAALAGTEHSTVTVLALGVRYPQGAEKMLIRVVTGRTVPDGKLPFEVGVVVSNVQTLYAIQQAAYLDRPLIDRVVTVSGRGITTPKNVRVALGTPVSDLAEFCGGFTDETTKVVAGGPMTGTALPSLDYSVTKGLSGLLFLTQAEFRDESPCIHCGACVDVCPMRLMPLKLAAFAKVGKFSEARTSHLSDCFECGSCAWVCPAHIKIVSWIKYAKNYIRVKGIP